jgi:sec-independent protein translocase protein TatB
MMANLGMADTLILMVLALVVFGPRRLPQIGRQIGKLMYEFRKASNDFKFQMEEELRQAEEADRRKKEEEDRPKALAAAPLAPQLELPATSTVDSAVPPESVAPATPETATEGPYSGETSYPPDVAAEETRSGESTEKLTAAADDAARLRPEASIESGVESRVQPSSEPRIQPRIKPVSTGEVVAANPPGRSPQQAELFESNAESAAEPGAPQQEDATTASESTTPDAANGTHRSEPAAHHG